MSDYKITNIFDPGLPDDTMVTAADVCAALKLNQPITWLRWAKAGKVPAPYPVGTLYRWRLGDIRAYLNRRRAEFVGQSIGVENGEIG